MLSALATWTCLAASLAIAIPAVGRGGPTMEARILPGGAAAEHGSELTDRKGAHRRAI
jgi:hypothetical protein